MIKGFTTDEVVELTGATVRQLDDWATAGLLKQGGFGGWGYMDMLTVSLIQKLEDFGFPLDKISEIIDGFDDAIEGTLNLYLVGNEKETHWIEHRWPESYPLLPTCQDPICIRVSDIIRDLNTRLKP